MPMQLSGLDLQRQLAASSMRMSFHSPLSHAVGSPHFEGMFTTKQIQGAFKTQNIKVSAEQAKALGDKIDHTVGLIRENPRNTQIQLKAVEIATGLGLNPQTDTGLIDRVKTALTTLSERPQGRPVNIPWSQYYSETIGLNSNADFLRLTRQRGYSPVKISWEDIGRNLYSSVGPRISDVAIWARENEKDPKSAQMAVSVRRDQNFRDRIHLVPAENIKVHVKGTRGGLEEFSLPERLKQLGLSSKQNDDNVIVSNQFAVVPVPGRDMGLVSKKGKPPRTAFNFSIYPYGSKTFVITDVIEGSANAVVGSGGHQLLYANVNGKKAPFTASRKEDRPDLVALENELKAQGMDADVQRYYLIQVPLKKDAPVSLSNMGEPPRPRYSPWDSPLLGGVAMAESAPVFYAMATALPNATRAKGGPGLSDVAIGTGEVEGKYNEGSGYRGYRAEEPIRVTVVYFVSPTGKVTEADMDKFATKFEEWDKQAIWGGSLVIPEDNK